MNVSRVVCLRVPPSLVGRHARGGAHRGPHQVPRGAGETLSRGGEGTVHRVFFLFCFVYSRDSRLMTGAHYSTRARFNARGAFTGSGIDDEGRVETEQDAGEGGGVKTVRQLV